MKRLASALAALAGLALGGCGGDSAPPPLAPAPPPPGIVELYPAPRSTRLPFDVVAWARFESPLDPVTVNDRTVFLLLDTRRVRSEVRWEAATNRIVIRPLEELTLARTHTVQLSTTIRTADGTPLAEAFEWQFRVVGVRLPGPVYPAPGAALESPYASPDWAATEPSAGDVRYEFYAGDDSAAVANRAIAPLRVHASPLYLPEIAWTPGSRVWWAVTTENRTVGERIEGPVSSFDVIPAGTPIDSIGNSLTRFGWAFSTGTRACGLTLPVGGGYTSGIVWSPALFGGPRKLAGAWIECSTTNESAVPRLFGADRAFSECAISYPGPPYVDPAMPELAAAAPAAGQRRLRFQSAALTARIERGLRGASPPGFLLRSGLQTNLAGTERPSMRLFYYVLPPGGPASAASPTSAHRPTRR